MPTVPLFVELPEELTIPLIFKGKVVAKLVLSRDAAHAALEDYLLGPSGLFTRLLDATSNAPDDAELTRLGALMVAQLQLTLIQLMGGLVTPRGEEAGRFQRALERTISSAARRALAGQVKFCARCGKVFQISVALRDYCSTNCAKAGQAKRNLARGSRAPDMQRSRAKKRSAVAAQHERDRQRLHVRFDLMLKKCLSAAGGRFPVPFHRLQLLPSGGHAQRFVDDDKFQRAVIALTDAYPVLRDYYQPLLPLN